MKGMALPVLLLFSTPTLLAAQNATQAGPAAPPAPEDHAAERFYAAEDMARSRRMLEVEHGGMRVSKIMAQLLEFQSSGGEAGGRWDVEGWYGGDLHRFVVKSEGNAEHHRDAGNADVQFLYARAVSRYTDLRLGVRQALEPASRTDASLGFQTRLPYWFDAEGTLFIGGDGAVLARLEGIYDLQLTQRLVLQPRVDLHFSAQDVPRNRIGSGLVRDELGLRLRYEIRRSLAPYLGISSERSHGGSADFARGAGLDIRTTSIVFGLRAWY